MTRSGHSDNLPHLFRSTVGETVARVPWSVNALQRPPRQPAYRDRWSDPAEGGTIDEDPEWQAPTPYGEANPRQRWFECSGEGLPSAIVAYEVDVALLIDSIHVHELRAPLSLPEARKDTSPHESELLRSGYKHADAGIRGRSRGESGNHTGAVVPGSMGATFQPSAAGEHARDDADYDACAGEHRRQHSAESRERESPQSRNSHSDHPNCHQTSSHGLTLGLRVQVRHDPPHWRRLTPGGNQIGILSKTFPERDPPKADSSGYDRQREQTCNPDGESRPRRRSIGGEEREQDQREAAETGAENRKCEQAGR